MFYSIEWRQFDPDVDANDGSHLLALFEEGSVEAYAKRMDRLFKSLTKGNLLVGIPDEESGEDYAEDYKRYIKSDSTCIQAIFRNTADEFNNKTVAVAYLINLDEDALEIVDFRADTHNKILRQLI